MLGLSLGGVRALPQSEIQLWCAHFLRKKGIPVGDDEAMQKLVEQTKKAEFDRETQEILKTIQWT